MYICKKENCMKTLTETDIQKICSLYKEKKNIETVAKEYSIDSRRVRRILQDRGIEIQNSHKKTVSNDTYIEDNMARFGKNTTYVAVSKIDGTTFKDYLNKGGTLTHYIQTVLSIEVPSLFKRKKYFHEHGCQWYEQWFDIIAVEAKKTKKCPYCSWETTDVENKSGAFLVHLQTEHNISPKQYAHDFPSDTEVNRVYKRKEAKKNLLKDEKTLLPVLFVEKKWNDYLFLILNIVIIVLSMRLKRCFQISNMYLTPKRQRWTKTVKRQI